jgi:hypothetical protein
MVNEVKQHNAPKTIITPPVLWLQQKELGIKIEHFSNAPMHMLFLGVAKHLMNRILKWEQLTLMQQLNCICNTQAKILITTALNHGYHDKQTSLLPKEDVALFIWGNKITGDISSPLHFHASKEVARKYLATRKKDKWSNEHFDAVDWEHLDLALKSKEDMYKIWRSKQHSGFCGLRIQVGCYSGEILQDKGMSKLQLERNRSTPYALP